jgi:hypothetical protein
MQNGWTQTFPGGPDYEYSVVVEPNNVYGPYNFGNTDQPVTKYGGGDGTPGNPYKILTAEHMNQIGLYQEDWSSHFILMNDINMSGITGEQYNMIGYHNSDEDFLPFTGTFDGNNHTINYFSYETSSDQRLAGMFGYIENAQITDLTLTNATVSSNGDYVGALAGCLGQGTVINCHADASVSGDGLVGGLIGGAVQSSTVDQCSSSGVISGTYQSWFLGGLAGFVRDSVITNSFSSAIINGENEVRDVGGLIGILHSSSLANCYATGTVTVGTGSLSIGGLLGTLFSSGSTVEQCYSTGEINAGDNSEGIGGLIGSLSFGSLKSSYSTGAVSANASSNVGGLVGGNSGSIIHCYSRGNVTSYNESDYIGGFVGATWGEIFCCYSIGTISATSANNSIGGFSGRSFGVVNSFWDTQTSGLNYSVGGKERTTVQMQQIDNYINWNTPTETNWVIDENNDYPHLAWEGTAGTNLPTLPITDYLDGQGTSAQPFLIYDANALNVIGVFYDDWDKDYLLASNIDMTMIGGNEFNMIGTDNTPFSGSFDGNGYWIDNFLYSSMGSESNIGLFSVIGGIVNNLNFENASISLGGGSSIGVLAGHLTQSGIVENCYVQGNIETTMPSDIIGGVAGSLEGSMINCERLFRLQQEYVVILSEV